MVGESPGDPELDDWFDEPRPRSSSRPGSTADDWLESSGSQTGRARPSFDARSLRTKRGAIAVAASAVPDPLKANNSASVKTVVEALTISVARASNLLTFSWSTNGASAYVLESATNLVPPVVWTPETNPPPHLNGNQQNFTIGTTNARKFFRLRAPGP